MTRNVICLLLMAMIVACPLWCRSGACASAEECCAQDCTADKCCDQEPAHDQNSCNEHSDHDPSQPCDNSPCSLCQCFCGGAVIEQHDYDVMQQVANPLHDLVLSSDSIADILFRNNSTTTLAHEVKIASGRSLCILHMSLLL